MPIVDDPSQPYFGVEYVGLYPIVTEERARNGKMNLYVFIESDYVYLNTAIDE